MSRLEELLERKEELENRKRIIKSFKISMNVGKKPKIIYEEKIPYVGITKLHKEELTNEQNQFFYDFVYAELEKCNEELEEVNSKLESASSFLEKFNQ